MAHSSEIEKLERRWMENPTGLTFAPLAEAYRRAGDQARALEVLELGLAQHPAYVPALIVQARCALDARLDGEAEAAFHAVLQADPHNLIALKGLADICELTKRPSMARDFLDRMLEADPTHGEAGIQRERITNLLAQRDASRNLSPVAEAVVESESGQSPVLVEADGSEIVLDTEPASELQSSIDAGIERTGEFGESLTAEAELTIEPGANPFEGFDASNWDLPFAKAEPPEQPFEEHISLEAAAALPAIEADGIDVRDLADGPVAEPDTVIDVPVELGEETGAEAEEAPAAFGVQADHPAPVEWAPSGWGLPESSADAQGGLPEPHAESVGAGQEPAQDPPAAEAAEPDPVEAVVAENPETGVPGAVEGDDAVTLEQLPVSGELMEELTEATDDGDFGTSHSPESDGLIDGEPVAGAPERGISTAEPDAGHMVSEAPPVSVGSVHFGSVHGSSEPDKDQVEVEQGQVAEPPMPEEESAPIATEPVAELEPQPEVEPRPVIDLRLEGEEYLPVEHGWVSSTDWSDGPEPDSLTQVEDAGLPVAQAVEQSPLEALEEAVQVGNDTAAEAAAPDAEPELVALAVAAELVTEVLIEAPEPVETEDTVEVVDGAFEEDEAAEVPDAAAEIEPELVITETMAEVFLRQGHRPLALAVYAQLLEREPHNQRLLDAVARLRGELLETLVRESKTGTAPVPEEPVGSFLARVLGPEMPQDEPPPAVDPGPLGGRPTRPADDPSLSLSTIFGEDAQRRGMLAEGAEGSVGNAEPSFDEFFGAEGVPAGAGGDEAELEQFNAWLRSLQR